MKKTVEVKLIVDLKDEDHVTAAVKLDFDVKQFKDTKDLLFLNGLKLVMEQQAQAIVQLSHIIAEISNSCNDDDDYDDD